MPTTNPWTAKHTRLSVEHTNPARRGAHVAGCLAAITTAAILALVAGCTSMDRAAPRAQTTPAHTSAQPAQFVHSDFLRTFAQTNRFRLGAPGNFQPLKDGSGVLFTRSASSTSFVQDLWEFDASTRSERLLLTASQLLAGEEESLTPEEKARRERARSSSRGISGFQVSDDSSRVLVPLSGKLYVAPLSALRAGNTKGVRTLTSDKGAAIDPVFSPDGTMIACARGGALYITHIDSNVEWRVSPLAHATLSYGEAEFVAQEEMDRSHGFWWSPDSSAIAYQETDVAGVETFTIADAFNPGAPAQTWPYPRAGKTNAKVALFVSRVQRPDASTRAEPEGQQPVRWDAAKFPYLAKVAWGKPANNAPLFFLVQNRTQTEQVLLRATGSRGTMNAPAQEVLRERDPAWLNLLDGAPHFLSDGSFLWMREDASLSTHGPVLQRCTPSPTGTRIETIAGNDAKAGLVLQRIMGFDEKSNSVLLSDAAHNPGASVIAWSLNDALPLRERLTEPGCLGEDAMVSAATPHGLDLWVRTTSPARASAPNRAAPTFEVLQRETVIGTIASFAAEPPFTPNVEFVHGLTARAMHGAIIRPQNFDKNKKYPVLDFAYAGPHSKTVNANARAYLLHQWFADQGFIVVSMDGRGTPDRGPAWEREIKNNLIDAALDDHCAALHELCAKYPEMDATRIGVNGWSFGGYYAAMATMRRPDVYKAGVSGAPVADWRDYDTHYTERYMGLPEDASNVVDGITGNTAGYDASSVLTYAKDLRVPLLIIHGTADDNVYPVHSLKIADALIRANRDFVFMPLPGQTHGVSKPEWVEGVQTRIARFFAEHLQRAKD